MTHCFRKETDMRHISWLRRQRHLVVAPVWCCLRTIANCGRKLEPFNRDKYSRRQKQSGVAAVSAPSCNKCVVLCWHRCLQLVYFASTDRILRRLRLRGHLHAVHCLSSPRPSNRGRRCCVCNQIGLTSCCDMARGNNTEGNELLFSLEEPR